MISRDKPGLSPIRRWMNRPAEATHTNDLGNFFRYREQGGMLARHPQLEIWHEGEWVIAGGDVRFEIQNPYPIPKEWLEEDSEVLFQELAQKQRDGLEEKRRFMLDYFLDSRKGGIRLPETTDQRADQIHAASRLYDETMEHLYGKSK